MEPLEFFLGVAAFGFAVKLKKPLRKAAVITATQVLGIVDSLKTTAYSLKEELEDIAAEAQYENMKRHVETMDERKEKTENDNNNQGGM